VVYAGAHEGQSHGDVHALVQPQVFDRNQPLVVVLGHHDVEVAAPRPHENGVAGPGAAGVDALCAGLPDGGGDVGQILVAELAVFARVRVQARHRDARGGDAQLQAGLVRQPNRAQFGLRRDGRRHRGQGHVDGDEQDT